MRGIIVLGSSDLDKKRLEEFIQEDTIIIGADSGCNKLYEFGIKPNYIIGDFDSIDKEVLDYYGSLKIRKYSLEERKDLTDGEASILLARDLGCNEIYLASTLKSDETDQLLGNILLLTKFRRVYLFNNREIISFIKLNKVYVNSRYGKEFSIIPLEESRINIKGSIYDTKVEVNIGDTRTLRNKIKEDKAEIEFLSGSGLIIHKNKGI